MLVAQTAAIAAKSLGIESLFTSSVQYRDTRRFQELLKLPTRMCLPIVSLVLGYPAGKPGPLKGRLQDTGIVHRDAYRRLGTEQLDDVIAGYDHRDMQLSPDQWKNSSFRHYLEWYCENWRHCRRKGAPPEDGESKADQAGIHTPRVLRDAGLISDVDVRVLQREGRPERALLEERPS